MSEPLVPKNLVRWRQPGGYLIGTVTRVDNRTIHVRFDEDRAEHSFAWPSDVLERIIFEQGQHVALVAGGEIGVVQASIDYKGVRVYKVGLSGGQAPSLPEDSVRPAVLKDPVQRLRAGELHATRRTNLRVAATRLLFGYKHDELSTLGNSRVEIKPHQVGVVHRVANSYPHRFILADEVGLGKTIEAGLLIRELLARGVVKRVLILAPSGLVGQWQQELKTKFNLAFAIYNGDTLRWLANERPDENPWTAKDFVLSSTSYASWTPERQREIAAAGWDMIVIDEAHHVRRRREASNKTSATRLYRMAEELSDPDLTSAQSMLLLTATPMQLDPFELYSLIELLDPALFPTEADFNSHRKELAGLNRIVERVKDWPALGGPERTEVLGNIEQWLGEDVAALGARAETDAAALVEELEAQHRLSRVMVRNRKSVVGGFMPRVAAIWPVDLTEEEWAAQRATEDYLRTGYARSKVIKNNALGFLMTTFQKMSASSSYTLKRSLERRIERLESVSKEQHAAEILDETTLEEMPTAEALDALLTERIDLDWEEVKQLETIVERLETITIDSKTLVLQENLSTILRREADAKVIIFTQFRDTQDYLSRHIGRPWTVNLFHGGLKPQEKDAAVAAFRDGSGPQVLVSTEAGGEGRNFQYCHMLINYDLPWNPMKVEQRIGRVDRIGQDHPVTIFNFSTNDTIEERVVSVLTDRIGVFKETIGGLDPILGEIERDLSKIFLAADRERDREIAKLSDRLDIRMAAARDAEQKLADLIMDTRSYRKEEVELLLQKPAPVKPRDVKAFVLAALKEMGVQVSHDEEHEGVYTLTFNSVFERHFEDEVKRGRTRLVTFSLSVALEREEIDFLAFGHPIVDGLIELVRTTDLGGITSVRTVLTDEIPETRGWLFVYALELTGMEETRELFPIFIHEDGSIDNETGTWLLDRSMTGRREEFRGSGALPDRSDDFERIVSDAESAVVTRTLDRQFELEQTNHVRLEEERRKQERFFDYRAQAAADKVTAVRRTVERLRTSPEHDDQRILPVWEKNLFTAEGALESVEEERVRRLAELDGRDQVSAQHELMSASYVSVEPDPAPLFEQVRAELTPSMFATFQRLCARTTADELCLQLPLLVKRRQQLTHWGQKHGRDVRLALSLADALAASLAELDELSGKELNLLSGAVAYFLEVDDEEHDLKSPNGFDDDRQVANIVLEVVGRPDLVVEYPATVSV